MTVGYPRSVDINSTLTVIPDLEYDEEGDFIHCKWLDCDPAGLGKRAVVWWPWDQPLSALPGTGLLHCAPIRRLWYFSFNSSLGNSLQRLVGRENVLPEPEGS